MVQAAHVGLAGLGLCDRNSLAGVVRAHLAKREQNLPLKYHPGARLVFADGTPDILAYPRDRAGWGRLTRLLTLGNLRAEKGDCILHLDDLLAHVEGLELVVMADSAFVSRAQRSTKCCAAEPGPSHTRNLERPRISGAPLHFVACCAASGARPTNLTSSRIPARWRRE
jgi:DNA polymerase III alpha subunit